MLTDDIRILDLDGSVTSQRRLQQQTAGNAKVVDLRHLEGRLRFMATKRSLQDFSAALSPAQPRCLAFLGSGDFHHLSAALIAQWATPVSVIVFDNHPDWDISSPWLCCGSWINAILRFPAVRKVVVIGPGCTDLRGWHVLRGNVKAIAAGRLELFPASWKTSRTVLTRGRFLPCARFQSQGLLTSVHWKTIQETGWVNLLEDVIGRLPTEQVYVSIDKDCLRASDAVTNWEEGELALSDLIGAIAFLRRHTDIVGADITGEYSTGTIDNLLFRAISRADHPPRPKPAAEALQVNEETNLRLLQAFLGSVPKTIGN